ncbi:MAG: YihY/virulence factor BrkB family protein [Proteobacteria bacterium]|nr:YihY/virulence factor BrkB family protein [Pseudomonadota bacterium]
MTSNGTEEAPETLAVLPLVRESIKRLFADEAIPLAGNIAFRTLFSMFPFLIFLTALAGFFGTTGQARAAVDFLLQVAPEAIIRPLEGEIISILTVPRTDLLSAAALLTIWSAMAGVDSIRVGLNRAYDLRDLRSAPYLYAIEILVVIGAAIFFVGFSFFIVLLPLALRFAATHGIEIAGSFAVLEQMRVVLAVALLFFSVIMAHIILPAKRMPLRMILPGVTTTVVIWGILSFGFSYWLLHFNTFASTYSSLSGIFAAMFFVYLSALALIFGGEVNRVIDIVRQRRAARAMIALRSER